MTAKLEISFHGRVIEHLGIEMYHSPVAAIAELVSNAWDAEANNVDVSLPDALTPGASISIADDGDGMTLAQCQDRFLRVGYNRRAYDRTDRTRSNRPVMGRKGIGKFAGFGIAQVVQVSTISAETGEKTVFKLDAEKLLSGGDSQSYVDSSPMEVELVEHLAASDARRAEHGTTITLSGLTLKNTPSRSVFRRSMARRFLLLEYAEGFKVTINGDPVADSAEVEKVEFDFPTDYDSDKRPDGLAVEDGWGKEIIDGHTVQWRFRFYKDPIDDEDLAGVSIFSHGKLAQRPFQFQLSGGLGGQQGLVYLSGTVRADFIDEQATDLISTERQRINWENEASRPLLEWGQARVKQLLRIWQSKRAESKIQAINDRLAGFSKRLAKLENYEQKIVKRALVAIARITALSEKQFGELADAILTAWEGGRLQDLISDLAESDEMDAEKLVHLLAESKVITALHAAERVKSQLNLILGLEDRIRTRELENDIRDFIAANPWLISPEWDNFRAEIGVNNLIKEAADEAQLNADDDWNARIDLCLSSGSQLLILEFMRPGLTADWAHIARFERYVRVLREKVEANAHKFKTVSGILIADRLERRTGFASQLRSLRLDNMDAMDWSSLLSSARAQWIEYFEILSDRAPGDERMEALRDATRAIGNRSDSDGGDETAPESATDSTEVHPPEPPAV